MKAQEIKYICFDFLYRILRFFLFKFNPEDVHNRVLKAGASVARHSLLSRYAEKAVVYRDSVLSQNICGIRFENPLGLAAGFDKNANLCDAVRLCGFGFAEVGSVTGEKCVGNPRPRLWRLPKSRSICVWYGLVNDGAEAVSDRLRGREFKIPLGISIAKTNSPETVDMIKGAEDYIKAYKAFYGIGDYLTLNISCPNTYGGEPFMRKEYFKYLMEEISKLQKDKPIFVKISPDLNYTETDDIIDICLQYCVDGIIISNLTKDRKGLDIKDGYVPEKGGLSGKLVEERANRLIGYVYKKAGRKLVIIGCGGIFTGRDAYRKIKLGASLLQMVTGLIYNGPHTPAKINYELSLLLKRDRYTHISQAIGSDLSVD